MISGLKVNVIQALICRFTSLFGDIRSIYGLLANGVSSSQVPGLLFWTSFDLGGQ